MSDLGNVSTGALAPAPNEAEPNKQPGQNGQNEPGHSVQPVMPEDSAVTKAEKINGNGLATSTESVKRKIDTITDASDAAGPPLKKGTAPIKAEYLIKQSTSHTGTDSPPRDSRDRPQDARDRQRGDGGGSGKRQKQRGQNTAREFGSSRDAIPMCSARARENEFTPTACQYGNDCKFTHDIRKYLKDGKRSDLTSFNATCPVWAAIGKCSAGWRCRFAGSHMQEITHEDGRKELVLLRDEQKLKEQGDLDPNDDGVGVVNMVPVADKIAMRKKQVQTPKTDAYMTWLNKTGQGSGDGDHKEKREKLTNEETKENQASYTEPPPLASEKRRLYYGPETPILAPLTTQGNLPFRRLAVDLGAQVTWSEMACAMPIISGEKSEWALLKAHESETKPPAFTPKTTIVDGYDPSKDLKFGAQISASKPWLACKTTEILTSRLPNLRAVDLNCGCPIDLIFRQGAGSALMDSPGRLEKILRGMNIVSGEVPITVKIRMGVKDGKPTADRLMERLAFGGTEAQELGLGAPGVQAITLHGRSRQQRYTRSADWEYISECKALINSYNKQRADLTDTIREPDARYGSSANKGEIYFVGNGDCYSHEDYYSCIEKTNVDTVMVARGALIKPWIFEEIAAGQHLDKTASERLEYIERFARYGLQTWGSDEMGIGTTRRFLLEWLSFACRYVPVGLLEHLPPNIQDRPPAYRGRNEMETLLSSDNYKDWIKISEMFLGPAHKDFKFEPKHKSNSYESVEAEG